MSTPFDAEYNAVRGKPKKPKRKKSAFWYWVRVAVAVAVAVAVVKAIIRESRPAPVYYPQEFKIRFTEY